MLLSDCTEFYENKKRRHKEKSKKKASSDETCDKEITASVKLTPRIKKENKNLDYDFEVPFSVKLEPTYSCKIKKLKKCDNECDKNCDKCRFVLFSTVHLKPSIEYEEKCLTQTKEFSLSDDSAFKVFCLHSREKH